VKSPRTQDAVRAEVKDQLGSRFLDFPLERPPRRLSLLKNESRGNWVGDTSVCHLANLTWLDAHSDDADRRPPERQ
jgi:hypothetical protein